MLFKARYRNNYDGEFVVVETSWRGGQKIQSREYLENPITNQHISGRAVIVGNGSTLRHDLLPFLEKHRGGVLGQKKVQTYGTEEIWKKISLDFCVENSLKNLKEIVDSRYNERTVIYTSVNNCIKIPQKFYVIPYGLRAHPIAQAAYLAAFDGHAEVYLIGVEALSDNNQPNNQLVSDLNRIFATYRGTQFKIVTDGAHPHRLWLANSNVEEWNYQKFISYCDI